MPPRLDATRKRRLDRGIATAVFVVFLEARLQHVSLNRGGIEVNRELVTLLFSPSSGSQGQFAAAGSRLFDRDDQEFARAARFSSVEIPASRVPRRRGPARGRRAASAAKWAWARFRRARSQLWPRVVPALDGAARRLPPQQWRARPGSGSGPGLRLGEQGKPSLGFGRKADPATNSIGHVQDQKYGASGILRRYAKGNHPVAIAESLDPILVDSHRRRIGNFNGDSTILRKKIPAARQGAAWHAPIGESAGSEADSTPAR